MSAHEKYERDVKSRPIWSILIFWGVACVSRRDELGMMLLPQLSHVTCPSSRLANRNLQRRLPFGKSALFWKRFTLDRVGHLLIPRWALQVLKLGSGDSWRKSCDLDFFDRENISHRPAVKEVTSPDNVCWFYFDFSTTTTTCASFQLLEDSTPSQFCQLWATSKEGKQLFLMRSLRWANVFRRLSLL